MLHKMVNAHGLGLIDDYSDDGMEYHTILHSLSFASTPSFVLSQLNHPWLKNFAPKRDSVESFEAFKKAIGYYIAGVQDEYYNAVLFVICSSVMQKEDAMHFYVDAVQFLNKDSVRKHTTSQDFQTLVLCAKFACMRALGS